MRDASTLSAFDRHSLFEACAREAEQLGGDERTAEYFFRRAQSSRVWLSEQGAVTIADMDIADWCGAIAWSAPGIGRTANPTTKAVPASAPARAGTSGVDKKAAHAAPEFRKKQPRSGARARGNAS